MKTSITKLPGGQGNILPPPTSIQLTTPLYMSGTLCTDITNIAIAPARCYPDWYKEKPDNETFTSAQAKYMASMIDPTVSWTTDEARVCGVLGKYTPSADWIDKQTKYYKDLATSDKEMIEDYQANGYIVLNRYLRGDIDGALEYLSKNPYFRMLFAINLTKNDLTPYGLADFEKQTFQYGLIGYAFTNLSTLSWKRDSLIRVIDSIVKQLDKLIINAPRLEKDIIVYRGVNKNIGISVGTWTPMKGYLSTTVDFTIALYFTYKSPDTYIFYIFVPKGSPCFFVNAADRSQGKKAPLDREIEILFPNNTQLFLESCSKESVVNFLGYTKDDPGKLKCDRINDRIILCKAKLQYIA